MQGSSFYNRKFVCLNASNTPLKKYKYNSVIGSLNAFSNLLNLFASPPFTSDSTLFELGHFHMWLTGDFTEFSPNEAFYEHQSTYEKSLSKVLQFFQLGQKSRCD